MAEDIRNHAGTRRRRSAPGSPARARRTYAGAGAVSGSNALRPEKVPSAGENLRLITTEPAGISAMNMGYLLFLVLAAVATVLICVNYLRLQSRYTGLQKENTSLTAALSAERLENDANYNRIVSNVNLEEVREIAEKRLGMVYPSASQVCYYEESENNYVKQYLDIPGNG